MKFRVEAEIGMGFQRYRLQNDGSWREVSSALGRNYPKFDPEDDTGKEDRLFDRFGETLPYLNKTGEMKISGATYPVNPRGGNMSELSSSAFIEAKVRRAIKPRRFSIEELREVIATGNDDRNNSLVVDLQGYFRLMDFSEARSGHADIAIRHETYCAGNGYVGNKAAQDDEFIEREYLSSMEGWIIHLMTDKLSVYQDCSESIRSEEELWEEVERLTAHLK